MRWGRGTPAFGSDHDLPRRAHVLIMFVLLVDRGAVCVCVCVVHVCRCVSEMLLPVVQAPCGSMHEVAEPHWLSGGDGSRFHVAAPWLTELRPQYLCVCVGRQRPMLLGPCLEQPASRLGVNRSRHFSPR